MTHTTTHPWLNQTKAGQPRYYFDYRHPLLYPIAKKKKGLR